MTIVVGENSYVTLEEADAWYRIDPHQGAAWRELLETDEATGNVSTARQEAVLLYARTVLDTQVHWTGEAIGSLAWPRRNAINLCSRCDIPEDFIPTELKQAQIMLAMHIQQNDPMALDAAQGIEEITVDVIGIVFDTAKTSNSHLPSFIRNLLSCYGRMRGSLGFVPIVKS